MRDGDIIAALAMAHASVVMKRGSYLLFVGPLVLAEADVAVDAKDGFVRIGFVFGSEIAQGDI